ncbi:hypothetical protein F5X97DRAFT_343979 [Nemania serpens]|nr:hypothetical protein F5X97DRAFT_343979 [Nemania serpens]
MSERRNPTAQSSVTVRSFSRRARPLSRRAQCCPRNLKSSEVVPSATYIERGQRRVEKELAFSLRQAMDAIEIKDEHVEDEAQDDKTSQPTRTARPSSQKAAQVASRTARPFSKINHSSSRTVPKLISFHPVKDNPAEAEKFVRRVFKKEQHSLDAAAAQLAPLYGFGPTSSSDALARMKAQEIFVAPEIKEPLQEFRRTFTQDKWRLPVASWTSTLALVQEHRRDEAWMGWPLSPISGNGSPDQYYARFVIRVFAELDSTPRKSVYMLRWLCRSKSDDDVVWVLFHALMYLQLVAMDRNKAAAPFKKVVRHNARKFADFTAKFASARKGIDGVES